MESRTDRRIAAVWLALAATSAVYCAWPVPQKSLAEREAAERQAAPLRMAKQVYVDRLLTELNTQEQVDAVYEAEALAQRNRAVQNYLRQVNALDQDQAY
jgi:hypothetical protein